MFACAQAAAVTLLCLYRQRLASSREAAFIRITQWLLHLDNELFALLALSYVFLLAYATDRLGLSVEIGAFAAGMTLNGFSKEVAERAEQRLGGLKDVFAAFFFGSIGLVVSGRFLVDNLAAILSVVGFIFTFKAATSFLPLWFQKTPPPPWEYRNLVIPSNSNSNTSYVMITS